MIAGWITIGDAPALVVLESLDVSCVVSVLWNARESWRTAMRGVWHPVSGEVELQTCDATIAPSEWVARVGRYLRGRRARNGAGMARWAPL